MRLYFNINDTEWGQWVASCEAVINSVSAATKQATEVALWDIMSDSLEQVPVDTGVLVTSAYFGTYRRADLDRFDTNDPVPRMGGGVLWGTATVPATGRIYPVAAKPDYYAANEILLRGAAKMIKKNYKYGGVLGYGDYRGAAEVDWIRPPDDRVNEKSGVPASFYAAVVHEDLFRAHPNGGNAKFLEVPLIRYATKFSRVLVEHWGIAISTTKTHWASERSYMRTGYFREVDGLAARFKRSPQYDTKYTWKQRGKRYQANAFSTLLPNTPITISRK